MSQNNLPIVSFPNHMTYNDRFEYYVVQKISSKPTPYIQRLTWRVCRICFLSVTLQRLIMFFKKSFHTKVKVQPSWNLFANITERPWPAVARQRSDKFFFGPHACRREFRCWPSCSRWCGFSRVSWQARLWLLAVQRVPSTCISLSSADVDGGPRPRRRCWHLLQHCAGRCIWRSRRTFRHFYRRVFLPLTF